MTGRGRGCRRSRRVERAGRHPAAAGSILLAGLLAFAGAETAAHGVVAKAGDQPNAVFDITRVEVRIDRERQAVVFRMELSGRAGASRPQKVGGVRGAGLFAHLWPLSLDPSAAGFEKGSGRLALAVAMHPDFDDTPGDDENGDGDPANDGAEWHAHWIVLQSDEACGADGLKVADILSDARPALPPGWPNLPVLVSSPGYIPRLSGKAVELRVPLAELPEIAGAGFGGMTASLRVNPKMEAPLWCVVDVMDAAAGDPGLPGKVD